MPHRDNRTENRTQEPMRKARIILLAVRVFLLVIVQVSVMPRLGLFGATPDILLSYLVVVSVTGIGVRRWRAISLSGLAAGFLVDAIGGVGFGVLPLFYFLIGAFLPNFVRRSPHGIADELLLVVLWLLPAVVLRSAVTLVSAVLTAWGGFSFIVCLTETLLPEMGASLLLALPVFLMFRKWR